MSRNIRIFLAIKWKNNLNYLNFNHQKYFLDIYLICSLILFHKRHLMNLNTNMPCSHAQVVNLWILDIKMTFNSTFQLWYLYRCWCCCCTPLLQLVCNLTSPHTTAPRHASSLLSGPVCAHHQAGGVRLHYQFTCDVQLWTVNILCYSLARWFQLRHKCKWRRLCLFKYLLSLWPDGGDVFCTCPWSDYK